ncbi:MAG: hypothetical protein ACI90V_000496 [Bacillariaceae sp.]|jgi:hypothetical protein
MAHPCMKVAFTKYRRSSPTVLVHFRYSSRSYHKSYPNINHPTGSISRQNLVRRHDHRQRLMSSSSSSHSDKTDKLMGGTGTGELWIYLGWSILGLVGIDQALQYKQEQEDYERRRLLSDMQIDADKAIINVAKWDETLPTLFTCKILHVDPSLDGTKMLTRKRVLGSSGGINRNIQMNDVVEILEAGIGPNQDYHLCRLRQQKKKKSDRNSETGTASAAIGWYPIKFLEKISD